MGGVCDKDTPNLVAQTPSEVVEKVDKEGEAAVTHKDLKFEISTKAAYDRAVGRHGVKVMGNPAKYVHAFIPKGMHPLNSLVMYPDVQPIPAHVVVKNFAWDSAPKDKAGHGLVTFPDGFNGHVPSQIATPSFLAWYGCNFAEHANIDVEFHVDHEIMDFNYSQYKERFVLNPKYGAGSLGLESHEFTHLECALEHLETSGWILLGKINKEENELYLTAFKVPQYHTMYMAPYTIHSNDHQMGLWRTMLSTFSEEETKAGKNYIDHVLLKHKNGRNVDLKFSKGFDPKSFLDAEGKYEYPHSEVTVIKDKLHSAKLLAMSRVGHAHAQVWELEDEGIDGYLGLVEKLGHGSVHHSMTVKTASHVEEKYRVKK